VEKMIIDYLLVNTGEAKILSWDQDVPAIATFDLGEEVAITAFNPATRTAGLARSADSKTIEKLLRSLLSPDTTLLYPVLQVRIVGGGSDAASEENLKDVLTAVQNADEGRNFINIVSADTGGKPYPQSFKITPFDGNVAAIDCAVSP
jgi:hypothetical protein